MKDPYIKQRGPVRVQFLNPPIPDRSHDYCATRNSYDGTPDSHPIDRLIGYGETEDEAKASLFEQEAEYFDTDDQLTEEITPEMAGCSELACKIINQTFLSLDGFEPMRKQMNSTRSCDALAYAASLARIVDVVIRHHEEDKQLR